MADSESVHSASPSEIVSGRQPCSSCGMRKVSPVDTHSECVDCLGMDHDMPICIHCSKLSERFRTARAHRLALWKHLNSAKCPSVKSVNEYLNKKPVLECLKLENIKPMLLSEVSIEDLSDGGDEEEAIEFPYSSEELDTFHKAVHADRPRKLISPSSPSQPGPSHSTRSASSPLKGTLVSKEVLLELLTQINNNETRQEKSSHSSPVPIVSSSPKPSVKAKSVVSDRILEDSVRSHGSIVFDVASEAGVLSTPSNDFHSEAVSGFGLFPKPSPQLAGDDSDSDSEANVPLSQLGSHTSELACRLQEGESFYDWDVNGVKQLVALPPGSELFSLVMMVNQCTSKLGKNLKCLTTSDISHNPLAAGSGLLDIPSTMRDSQALFTIPPDILRVWKESRESSFILNGPLVPSVIRKCYKLVPEDWAFLGAVRRPDYFLQKTCTVRNTTKGVKVLENGEAFRACNRLDKIVQATAHTLRTNIISYHAAQHAVKIVDSLKSHLSASTASVILQKFSDLENCLKLGGTAVLHNADALSRINAFALRNLRNQWLFHSSLSRDMVEAIKKSPLCEGNAPSDKGLEFIAPIVGSVLTETVDKEYAMTKKSDALLKKTQALKRSLPNKSSSTSQSTRSKSEGYKIPRSSESKNQKTFKHKPTCKSNFKNKSSFKSQAKGKGRGQSQPNPKKSSFQTPASKKQS